MFENKTVWITGASSGIGKAFAEAFYANGANVILSALTKEELLPVAADLKGSASLAFDVADFDILPEMTEQALSLFGSIDILVNNAGITQRALAQDTEFPVYQRLIDVDLMAPIALTQLITPHMRARGSGKIIAVASIAGKFGAPLRTAYSAAKHGLIGYFDALRAEVIHDGIEVYVVAPGAVQTNLARNALTGSGEAFGKSDKFIEGGYDPTYIAERTFKQMANGKREIIIGRGLEMMAYRLRRFFPERAFDRIAQSTPAAVAELDAMNQN